MKVHCLFEQSGTFKNEFIKLGFPSFDYDILNDFNQTDFRVDLFNEITRCFYNKPSIFDDFSSSDLIFAFFPCIRFEDQSLLLFRCDNASVSHYPPEQKCLYDIKLMSELSNLYILFHQLVYIAYKHNFKLIIENPYSTQHFLYRYSFLKPTWIDYDRRLRGDYFKKPTQFYFINFIPKNNFVSEALSYNRSPKTVDHQSTVYRSLIHKDYARRFIKEFIL